MAGQRERRRLAPYVLLVVSFVMAFATLTVPALAAGDDGGAKSEGATEQEQPTIFDELIVPRNDLSEGGELYRSGCAACHAATGIGGALSFRDNAPPLDSYTALEVAAAIRGGPGEMPFFGPKTLNDEELEQIVTYVLYLQQPDDLGGAPIGRVGPVMEGLVAWLVGMSALILGLMWIGDRRA